MHKVLARRSVGLKRDEEMKQYVWKIVWCKIRCMNKLRYHGGIFAQSIHTKQVIH